MPLRNILLIRVEYLAIDNRYKQSQISANFAEIPVRIKFEDYTNLLASLDTMHTCTRCGDRRHFLENSSFTFKHV